MSLKSEEREINAKILKALIKSHGEENLTDDQEWKDWIENSNEEQFPLTDKILDALAKSLTDLLCCKVSEEVHQRYSVRLCIIDVVREWSRIKGTLSSLRTFARGEHTLEFIGSILRKYLTHDFLNSDVHFDTLLSLARALMCLIPKNPCFLPELEKVIDKIVLLESTVKSDRLLVSIVNKSQQLQLTLPTIERIVLCQRFTFIEKPLIDSFASVCFNSENLNVEDVVATLENTDSIGVLAKHIVEFPSVFQLTSSFLKEVLVSLEYSTLVVDYIQSFLKYVSKRCDEHKKNMLDLYPRNLQPCVILLKIEPHRHTQNSKNNTLRMLTEIFSTSEDDALVLLTHFPKWLEIFSTHFTSSTV